jgi:hypothetical protein
MIAERSGDVVIVASEVRVATFTQLWLVDKAVLPREMLADSIFTPMVVNAATQDVQLTVVPNRIQIASRRPEGIPEVARTASRFLEAADSAIGVSAVGINYRFVLTGESADAFAARTERLVGDLPSLESFKKGQKPRFGISAIRVDGKIRTQLEVSPVHAFPAGVEAVLVSVNSQLDTSSRQEAIADLLNRSEDLKSTAELIATSVDKDLTKASLEFRVGILRC